MNNLYKSIPDKVLDWKTSGDDATYNRKTLFDYLNGGAEVYLAFDFRQVYVRRYKGPAEDDEIVLEIYDMGSSKEAFGIFSCEREDRPAGIGQDSEYGFGLLRFWKGRYFVSINALGDDKKAEPVIKELGKKVADLIEPPGQKPGILQLLPREGLIVDRISYFHHNINLSNRFFIASENLLNLTRDTNCVLGEYQVIGNETAYLLIIQYETPILAEEAYASFLKYFLPEATESGISQMENNKWTLAKRQGCLAAIIFEAPDKEWGLKLQAAIPLSINNPEERVP